jgi:serine/threonine protein kinase
VAELFDAASLLGQDEQRSFLANACQGDPALLAEVESLLAHDNVAGPIDNPVWVPDDLLMSPLALVVGASLGPYVIESVLGIGGMGEVYQARDTKLGRRVALKVLPQTLAEDPDRRARFQREAQVLAALNHPHIAAVYGFEDTDRAYAIALELVDGPTLAERLARGPVALVEAIAIARQIVDALDAAHELGIVHRDLKPANIKIRPDGTVKVLDFGLARFVLTGDDSHETGLSHPLDPVVTAAGALLGTAAYMSPEQATGLPADARSDIWAFGCLFYELLTGTRAFPGESVADTLGAVLRAEPDWAALPRDTPQAIRRLRRVRHRHRSRRAQCRLDGLLRQWLASVR